MSLTNLNQQTKELESGGRNRTKPRHRARGNGMIWFDQASDEWACHAKDYLTVRGAELLPESLIGGRGNWFVYLGEAARTAKQMPKRRKRA